MKKIRHSHYAPDFATSDFHLFWSLQNYLDGLALKRHDEVETTLSKLVFFKVKDFYKNNIMELWNCQKDVADNDRAYANE